LALYAHVALQELNILPGVFKNLPRKERAFIIASIDIQRETEKEAMRRLKRK
jgi:hypothetical protein